jgi:dynein heavy chain 2, cytosolic
VQNVESAISKGNLSALLGKVEQELREVTSMDCSQHALIRLKVRALILDVIHHRDIAMHLLAEKCCKIEDWAWQKQLRYYIDEGAALPAMHVRMVDAVNVFSWEYQGNAPKLVYTPLTDKCYLTMTQGMALGYGGNPYGPAGTGKTESVKALGQVSCPFQAVPPREEPS